MTCLLVGQMRQRDPPGGGDGFEPAAMPVDLIQHPAVIGAVC
jgi:hypothetical protein